MTVRPLSKLIAIASFVAAVACPCAASAAPAPPMTVQLHQASGRPISYFQLDARPGHHISVGTLELRNRRARPITVLLDPIDAVTAATLGSAYAVRGLSTHGPARWTRLARRRVVLGPHAATTVAVDVLPSKGTDPGDYLSGIGVQALEPPRQTKAGGNVAVSSTQRYAVGLEVQLPGPRHPRIRLTGADIKREPAGIAFSISGRNPGNVILQGVHGQALITQGRRVVARAPMGPGTFVTGTSIAYPIPTPREQPREGTVYRVRAFLRYRGGIARLDTRVRFGGADARRQETFGGPKAHNGFPWLILAIAVVVAALLAALLWKLHQARTRSPVRTLDRALAAARASGDPLSVILVGAESDGVASRPLGSLLRKRLRPADTLCRLDGRGFLVVAPDTNTETADVLAADMRRHLDRASEGSNGMAIEVHAANGETTGAELLERVIQSSDGTRAPTPTG
jgi:hypothetical protein